MNAGNVSAFGCGLPHPEHGEKAACIRQRNHPGDHRAAVAGNLYTWPDTAETVDVHTDGSDDPVATHRTPTEDELDQWRASLQAPGVDGGLYAPRDIPGQLLEAEPGSWRLDVSLALEAKTLAWLIGMLVVGVAMFVAVLAMLP